MRLKMWMYDLAREQAPTADHLDQFCDLTQEAGYNAIGFYLEHRFAFPRLPWAHGVGVLTPDEVRRLEAKFPDLQIIPLVNLLGHCEGLLYTEAGRRYAEEKFRGMQACPSKPEFIELANDMLADVLDAFSSPIIHIGGDETYQLGKCPVCAARVAEYEQATGADGKPVDGKARLYGEHFGNLVRKVLEAGRRPAVWGDMFFTHPTALESIPKETLIFDWQYFGGPHETSRIFRDRGYDVVYSPTINTYSASWCHLPQSERNVRENVEAAQEDGVFGVCVTSWECEMMGNYALLFPALRAAGKMMSGRAEVGGQRSEGGQTAGERGDAPEQVDTCKICQGQRAEYCDERRAPEFLRAYLAAGERHEEWARLMGIELQDAGGIFAFTGIRSSLKCRLLLYSNPFLFWLHHSAELCGEVGDRALAILERAICVAPDSAYRGVSEFIRLAIEFVRYAEDSHRLYAAGIPGEAVAALMPCRQVFEHLEKIAKATHIKIGGSLADIERCRAAKRHVEVVMRRIKDYGDGSLGYLPSFETLTHPKFVPHDQGNWWLINDWANE